MARALILVDIQNDFLPGGALAVPEGDEVIAIANAIIPHFQHVIATQDWHPADHGSFASQNPGAAPGELGTLAGLPQVMWPDHCVQGSHGAAFAEDLHLPPGASIFRKGTDPTVDSYSGFFDNDRRADTGLADHLRGLGVDAVYVMGLATDYCVRFTALDAVSLGFDTTLIADGCRGVGLKPEDIPAAVEAMSAAGVHVIEHAAVLDEG